MPEGQRCGHCRQPNHNRQTCEAYRKYVELEDELEQTRRELREAEGARDENQNIIKAQADRISQLQGRIKELISERDYWKNMMGAFAVPSWGTGKGTSKHADQ